MKAQQSDSIRDEWDEISDRVEARYAKLDEESCLKLPKLFLASASQMNRRVGS